MAALRFLASVFLLLAAVILIADVTMARPNTGKGMFASLGHHWDLLAPAAKAAAEAQANAARAKAAEKAAAEKAALAAATKGQKSMPKGKAVPKAAAAAAPVDAEAEVEEVVSPKAPGRMSAAFASLRGYILRPLLVVPSWMLFLSMGLLCAYIGRRRRRVNVFVN
jgi:hypothetical protein